MATPSKVEQPGEAESGVPLGIIDDYEYELSTITLGPSERLVLYTDGINEAPDAAGQLFGIPTLEKMLTTAEQNVTAIGSNMTRPSSNTSRARRKPTTCAYWSSAASEITLLVK